MKNVKVFADLQDKKIERAKRLLNIVQRVGIARVKGEEAVAEKGIRMLAEHLPVLRDKIKVQQKLCGTDNQCIALLHDEIEALEGKNKSLGESVIVHVKRAAVGAPELEVSPVINALILIIGREATLIGLYEAAERAKAA
jgi:hypothetical protein